MKSKNQYELNLMRKSGGILSAALKRGMDSIKVGTTEAEVDGIITKEIYRLGGDLSYKTVPGYKYATCITVNNEVVHGIPTGRKFQNGDLVSIDLAVMYKGWHTDAAWSVLIGKDTEKEKFLSAGQEALWGAIKQAVPGNRVGDISNAIQTKIERAGYQVIRSLVGHGVGRNLHEEPEIPCFGRKNTGKVLESGMSLAIEVIYAKGSPDLVLDEDGWTFKTEDGSWGGLFEMTVIVDRKPEILTNPLWVVI